MLPSNRHPAHRNTYPNLHESAGIAIAVELVHTPPTPSPHPRVTLLLRTPFSGAGLSALAIAAPRCGQMLSLCGRTA